MSIYSKESIFENWGYSEIDFSHHLSIIAKSRTVSPLKGLQKYMYNAPADMISLAAGFPDPAYFPFASVEAEALVSDSFARTRPSLFSWIRSIFHAEASNERTERITIPKYGAHKGDIDLATALQYAPATGFQPLQDFIRQFTAKVFKPAYPEWTILANVGNTNSIHSALVTFCNPGEHILMEEWTYVSAMAAAQPLGILPASVKMDAQGMCSADLRRVLEDWDESVRGAKRPHVLYLVPIGQNPTGATMGADRKKAIYDICVKYDIIIIEDDPYYFFQEGIYSLKESRSISSRKGTYDETRFLDSLIPSFVRFDYQGRVIRLDSFSKVIAPGARMGWFTCNPFFAERFEREGETTTQMPCGFSQVAALITQLLSKHWGPRNFVRWLHGLQEQYTKRRNFFVDCLFDAFDVRFGSSAALFGAGALVYTAYVKPKEVQEKISSSKTPLFSFVPPSSGLFVWLKFHLKTGVASDSGDGLTIDEKIWIDLTKHGLLVAPGWVFAAAVDSEKTHELTFRLAYSYGSFEDIRTGVGILARVLKGYVEF